MSHELKVYTIVAILVAGTVFVAEKTKPVAVASTTVVVDAGFESYSQTKTSSLMKLKSQAATKKTVGFDLAQTLFDQEMESLAKGQNFKQRESSVRTQVQRLSSADLMSLAVKSVDTQLALNERLMAVYLVSLAGMRAHNALFEIVKTPYAFSKSVGMHSKAAFENQELSLRLRALQALDQLAILNPKQVQQTMKIVTKSSANSQIKNYAQVSVIGFSHGQPAKLSQWLNQTVASRGE